MAQRSALTDGCNVNQILRLEGVCAISTADGTHMYFYPDGKLTRERRAWLASGDGYRLACLRDYVLLSAGH